MEGKINDSKYGKIYYKVWDLDNPRLDLLIIHGLGEHIERYNRFASYMAKAGVRCFGFDLPGHGKSDGKRGHIEKFNDIVKITDDIIDIVKPKHLCLFGHSLGGLLASYVLLKSDNKLEKVIVSAPAFDLKSKVSRFLFPIMKLIRKAQPSFTTKNGISAKQLSHDKIIVKAYENDPLVHPYISISLFFEAIKAEEYCFAHFLDYKTPMLLVHGKEDSIVDKKCSEAFFNMLPHKGKTFKIIKDSYHEPHNELNYVNNLKLYRDFLLTKQ